MQKMLRGLVIDNSLIIILFGLFMGEHESLIKAIGSGENYIANHIYVFISPTGDVIAIEYPVILVYKDLLFPWITPSCDKMLKYIKKEFGDIERLRNAGFYIGIGNIIYMDGHLYIRLNNAYERKYSINDIRDIVIFQNKKRILNAIILNANVSASK